MGIEKTDAELIEAAIAQGYCTFAQAKECLDIQKRLVDMGLEPRSVEEILVEKKYITSDQLRSLRKAAGTDSPGAPAPAERSDYQIAEAAIREGLASFAQIQDALEFQNRIRALGYAPKPIESLLVDRGILTPEQARALRSGQPVPKPKPPKGDLRLGEIAVQKKYITRDQLEECLRIQEEARALKKAVPKLGELLVHKGYLRADQRDELLILSARAIAPFDIEGYEILSKIGVGGMGAVYKARQLSIGREVAIKILFPKYKQDAEYMERFLREARLLAKMNHPNIVSAIDAGEVGGVPYFVMEFIDGISVSQLLDQKGRLSERDAVKIGMHTARALHHAHKNHLVHRDIKPQNIMITREGFVKLCDLGIAKRTDIKEDASLTAEGMAIGTPYYISPEAALGRNVDIRADIYSLGATLYHLATGVVPFDSSSPAEILSMHVNAPLVPPKQRLPDLSEDFNELIVWMMQKEPDRRPQTPLEASQRMEEYLGRRPATVRRSPIPTKSYTSSYAPASPTARQPVGEGSAPRPGIRTQRATARGRPSRRVSPTLVGVLLMILCSAGALLCFYLVKELFR